MAVCLLLSLLAAAGLVTPDRPFRPARAAAPVPVQVDGAPPSARTSAPADTCYESYSDIWTPPGYFFAAGAGVEVLDDLHLGAIYVSNLCSFDVGYYKSSAVPTSATVTFRANNSGDDPPGSVLTTFVVPGLLSGANLIHVEVPASALTQDVWLGVSFDTDDAGLLLADPPWPGASDDLFLQNPPGAYYTFGGNPRANFMLAVRATGGLVSVEPASGRANAAGITAGPFPNPTTGGLNVGFAVRDGGRVRADVLDVTGRVVAVALDRNYQPGQYSFSWNGRTTGGQRAAPGVYLLRLTMPGFAGSRKVVLTR